MNSQKLRTGLFIAAITVSAVQGASKIVDKTYKGKEGPGGQTVYIDKHDKKYYVDEKGKKIYLKASEIHDKQQ
jgi:hypothetical protein